MHPADRESASAAWDKALSSGQAYEAELRLRRHDGQYRWHIARAVAIRDGEGHVVQWIGTNTDIHDQRKALQALYESERRLQLSQNAAGIASLELDIATGTVFGSDKFWEIWGLSPRDSVHISVLENIVVPDDNDIRSTAETRVAGTAALAVEYRIRRPDNGELRWLSRHIEFAYDAAGKPSKMFGVIQDVTARKEAEARQELLVHELEHRIKNILAMVAAIALQTLRNADIDTARVSFNERLKALAKAHDILNKTRWTNASIEEVVANTMAAFPDQQVSMSGPRLSINPKMALSLALAVNELGTNALKYGALSVPEGTVTIEWSMIKFARDGQQMDDVMGLRWMWSEHGGPPVKPPYRRGFGSLLLNRVLAADFNGSVTIDYRTTGVVCLLQSPLPIESVLTHANVGPVN